MDNTTPLALYVRTLADAKLMNVSSRPQYVLHTVQFQASRLRLFDADGSELEPQDERDRMKFDIAVSRLMYQELAPGATLALFEPRTKRHDGAYELIWGPFSFAGLTRGKYAFLLEWVSERNDYIDEAGATKTFDAVWLGTVRSRRFDVDVP